MNALLAAYFYLGSVVFVATIIAERWTSPMEMTVKDLVAILGAPIAWPVILLIAIYRTIKQ